MNLSNKKELASRVLNVGKGRIYFVEENLSEIKEAITRQDILDLHNAGAIQIKEKSGRKKIVRRRHRRRTGKIKKKLKNTKKEYVIITRKLRTYLKNLLKRGRVDKETYKEARKQIKVRGFKSKRNLRETLMEEK